MRRVFGSFAFRHALMLLLGGISGLVAMRFLPDAALLPVLYVITGMLGLFALFIVACVLASWR